MTGLGKIDQLTPARGLGHQSDFALHGTVLDLRRDVAELTHLVRLMSSALSAYIEKEAAEEKRLQEGLIP